MLVGDQYIGRLYITVDDPKVMQMCKPYRLKPNDMFTCNPMEYFCLFEEKTLFLLVLTLQFFDNDLLRIVSRHKNQTIGSSTDSLFFVSQLLPLE